MDYFDYKNGVLHCEDADMVSLAKTHATPAYVYSKATLHRHCKKFKEAFADIDHTLCYAVKANSNLSILKEIFSLGFGADVVSIGEIERSLLAGVDPSKIVFSGVGKKKEEILRGIELGIKSFNVESLFELERLQRFAEEVGKKARVCLRVNPNIDAKTNPKITTGLYTSKFGISEELLPEVLNSLKDKKNLELVGIACHIGSQITTIDPLKEATQRMADLAETLKTSGFNLEFINMGGGLGIKYRDENPPSLEEYAEAIKGTMRKTGLSLVLEPGRVLVGNIGTLITEVIGVKKTPEKNFVIVDAAMNDLLRPSMYDSYHEIISAEKTQTETICCDIVGPICESGDFLGKDRDIACPVEGDFLVVRGCGAYGATMASNYNSRTRPVELLVAGDSAVVIKRREKLSELWDKEPLG